MLVRLAGLPKSVLLCGRSGLTKPTPLARLLGRLLSLLSRTGRGPNERRLMPDVDSLLTCFVDCGVSSAAEDAPLTVLPPVRFRLRIVTLGGIYWCPRVEPVLLRGDPRGGVLTGAGSFDLADCTRCSSFCI